MTMIFPFKTLIYSIMVCKRFESASDMLLAMDVFEGVEIDGPEGDGFSWDVGEC